MFEPTEFWESLGEQTRLIRGGVSRSHFDETAEAIYPTSGFVYPSAAAAEAAFAGESDHYIYGRYGNPTVSMFEERLRLLEGAEHCFATASGMAAIYAALACQLSAGDRIVSSRALFGSCHVIVNEILPRQGVRSVTVDGTSLSEWEQALSQPTDVVFLETPSNPGLELVDLAAVCELARAAGAVVVVDNVFASPVLQKPLTFGADIVVYSATKHIDGQGRVLGGAVLSSKAFFGEKLQPFVRHTGPSLSPFNAWVLLKGLETIRLRVHAMSSSAEQIAGELSEHQAVESVRYPTLASHPQHELAARQMSAGGTVVALTLRGTKTDCFGFMDRLQLIDISNNLGDSKTLITHPATTTHRRLDIAERARLGITDTTLRLSVGLEDSVDLVGDLTNSLDAHCATNRT